MMLREKLDRILNIRVLGVDLGSSAVKMACISRKPQKIILHRAGIEPLPVGDVPEALKRKLAGGRITP